MGRRCLDTGMLRALRGMPPWYGPVTTRAYASDAIRHDTKDANGGRELHDLTRDPNGPTNLAREPEHEQRPCQFRRLPHRKIVRPTGVTLS